MVSLQGKGPPVPLGGSLCCYRGDKKIFVEPDVSSLV